MLRKLWALIRKEMRIAMQQPAQWALILLTPLSFVAVMGVGLWRRRRAGGCRLFCARG
jgi:hypothetical protein